MNLLDYISEAASSATGAATGWQDLRQEIHEKVARIPADVNEYGYDPWGFSPAAFENLLLPAALMYRYYFRVESLGLERLPEGRMLLIGNHAGQVAFDGMMVTAAMVLEADPPRVARAMGEYWLGTLPWMNVLMDRMGSTVGTRETAVDLLDHGEAVLAFPEGVRGMNKVYSDAYTLKRFGLGFMRLALATKTPIVPISIVGSEEQQPGLANLEGIARSLGMPSFPVTLTFPWLGPFGLWPLPVRYHIEFGEPLYFSGSPADEDDVVGAKVDQVKAAIQAGLDRGVERRQSIFL